MFREQHLQTRRGCLSHSRPLATWLKVVLLGSLRLSIVKFCKVKVKVECHSFIRRALTNLNHNRSLLLTRTQSEMRKNHWVRSKSDTRDIVDCSTHQAHLFYYAITAITYRPVAATHFHDTYFPNSGQCLLTHSMRSTSRPFSQT